MKRTHLQTWINLFLRVSTFYIKNKSMLENHEYIEDEDEVGKFQTIL